MSLNKRKRYIESEAVGLLRVYLPKGREDDDVYALYTVNGNGRIVERVGTGDAAYLPSLEENLVLHVRRMVEAHGGKIDFENLRYRILKENLEDFSKEFVKLIFSEPDEPEIRKFLGRKIKTGKNY